MTLECETAAQCQEIATWMTDAVQTFVMATVILVSVAVFAVKWKDEVQNREWKIRIQGEEDWSDE